MDQMSEKAFSIAASLARVKGLDLQVLIPAADPGEQTRLQARVQELELSKDLRIRFRGLTEAAPARLIQVMQASSQGPLFLPCEPPNLQGEPLQGLINAISNPVFLVRARSADRE
jgi:hypothetical protein